MVWNGGIWIRKILINWKQPSNTESRIAVNEKDIVDMKKQIVDNKEELTDQISELKESIEAEFKTVKPRMIPKSMKNLKN